MCARGLHLSVLKTKRRFCCSHQRSGAGGAITSLQTAPTLRVCHISDTEEPKSSPSSGRSVSPLLHGDCSLRDGTTPIQQNNYNLIIQGSQESNNTGLCVCCSLGAHQLCHFCVICARSLWIHGCGASSVSFFLRCYSGSFPSCI